MTMIPERKSKLTAALRSGEFRQGRSMLYNNQEDTYCCLGVACEVYRRETGDGEWVPRSSEGPGMARYTKFVLPDDPGSDLSLPEKVARWYGLDIQGEGEQAPLVVTTYEGVTGKMPLSAVNDDTGASFERIADVIDEQL